jgi:GWxTD domain-containing protein
MRRSGLLAVLLVGLFAGPATWAQSSDPMASGILAFREGRYDEAARTFEQVTQKDPRNAEAYFLLARLYNETTLKDYRKANRALDNALELEPDNVQYLVAKLLLLRSESWNFFSEKIREAKRREVAVKLLALDSTNAFAHHELGEAHIRDFWRYRNALMFPGLKFGGFAYRQTDEPGSAFGQVLSPDDLPDLTDIIPIDQAAILNDAALQADARTTFDPNDIFLEDHFDVETMKEQGVPVQDLSSRALRAYDRAIGHLEKALAVDPRQRTVYDSMMRIYALKGEYDEALQMLQEMYVFFPEDAGLWTYLGLAHYHTGSMEAASRSFLNALNFMDAETQHAYSTLEAILPDPEKQRYQADPVAYAAQFWTSKDPRYLTSYNERRLEHFARLTYADLLYGAPELNRHGWETVRGQILARYGQPRTDVVILPRNATEYRRRPVVDRASIIGGGNDNTTIMNQSMVSGSDLDLAEEANAYNIWDYGEFRFVFEDPYRNGDFRLYSPKADEIANGANPWINDYVIKAEETFREVPERYEYKAPGRQVEIPYLVTAFKGTDGKADLVVNYGIPIAQATDGQEMIEITANTGTFLINEQRDILVERRRTIYGLRTAQIQTFAETRLWVDTQTMQAPPGQMQVSVEFETASGGTVAVQRRAVTVPDFTTSTLALSDLLLAYQIDETQGNRAVRQADLVRNNLSMQPAPWSVFNHTQSIYLYFEAYNLQKGADGRTNYEVEAFLVPKDADKGVSRVVRGLFNSGRKGVSVRAPGSGTTTDEATYLILDAANQEPGLYTLRLVIHDRIARKNVEQEQDLFLE